MTAGRATQRGAPAADASRVAGDLRRLLRGDVEFDAVSRFLYATDAGLNQIEPLGVVSPRDTADVVRLVEYAAEHGLPLVGRGMGSGLAGGAVGAGIQVDFTRYMNRVLEIAPDGSWARVQPGLVMASLNQEAAKLGTFFAPDPSSENYCSLGGMIGTNSSGARTVAYGGTQDHVLTLEIVLADASVFTARPMAEDGAEFAALLGSGRTVTDTLAGRAFAQILPELHANATTIAGAMPRVVKNCSGYRLETVLGEGGAPGCWGAPAGADPLVHLQKLFVGAEGTLGLVTEATLNLVPVPKRRGIAMAYFPSVFASGEAVPGVLALGPTAVEIMDARFLALVRKHDSRVDAMLPGHTDTALLIEFEGAEDGELDEKFVALGRHLAGTDAIKVVRAETAEETSRLWTVRKSAVALALRMPGPRRALPFIEDVTVHPSEVPGYVDFLQRLFDREKVDAVMYGHVGDGNIHTRPLLDPKNPGDLRAMQRLYDEVSGYVRGIRGTMSGEHGDGLLRTPYLREMYGQTVYSLFSLVKNALDPQGLMNPGKKVGPQEERGTWPPDDGGPAAGARTQPSAAPAGPLLRDLRYGSDYRTLPQTPILHFPETEYEREIEKCHGCGQCKSVVMTTMCPTYKATRREAASPRAKANLLRAIITGAIDPISSYGEAAAKMVTDYCIACGMCAVECPSNVNIPKLMLEAKSKYRRAHRGTPTDALLGHAEIASALGRRFALLANPMLSQPLIRRLAEPLTGIDRRRQMPPFARRTLSQRTKDESRAGRAARETVSGYPRDAAKEQVRPPLAAYFRDLFAEYNDPELALAVLRVLQAHGVEVVVPEQRASGVPEMLYGYAGAAREAVRFNVGSILPWVRRGAALVAAEPTASFAFKVHYPDYLATPECSAVAGAAHDLGEFLVRYRADHPGKVPSAASLSGPWTKLRRIAYHQPCHLKAQQIGSPGLELLREIPGTEIIDLAAGCCGMAGTFGMKKGTYDLSMLTGTPLFERLAAVAPDIVASECSTCRLQIAEAASIRTVHPITLLAEAYGVAQQAAGGDE